MLLKFVSIGDEVQVIQELYMHENDIEEKRYTGKILEVLDDETFKINVPIEQSKVVPMEIGKWYHLLFYTKKGVYKCDCVVETKKKSGQIDILTMKKKSVFEKCQRREYYRIPCFLSLTYEIYDEKEENRKDELEVFQADVLNLSGGGLSFVSSCEYEKGTQLFMHFQIKIDKDFFQFDLFGKVLSSDLIESHKRRYKNRISFSGISKKERETIIKYVFQQERKQIMREKGLR